MASLKTQSPSTLLSLPQEIRLMIWTEVVGSDPILLYDKTPRKLPPTEYERIANIPWRANSPPTEYERLSNRPRRFFAGDFDEPPQFPPAASEYDKVATRVLIPTGSHQLCSAQDHWDCDAVGQGKAHFSLAWLRTCRTIYEEARPIVYKFLTLHICHPEMFMLLERWMPQSLKASLRSLEFGFAIGIRKGSDDTFTMTNANGWYGSEAKGYLQKWYRSGVIKTDLFSSLQKLSLIFHFRAEDENLAARTHQSPFDRVGQPVVMRCSSHEVHVKRKVDTLFRSMPLFSFDQGPRKVEIVRVRFLTAKILHWSGKACARDDCWCHERTIDQKNLDQIGLARMIESRLTKQPCD